MINNMRFSAVLIVCVAMFISCSCSDKPSRVHPPSIDAYAAGKAAMDQYDKNQDGKVAGEELQAAPSLRASLQKIDKDGDLAVSADEITARIKEWQEKKVGLSPVKCQITYRGRPLANATVTFEPEEFMGDNVKACVGITDQRGTAVLRMPDSELNLPGCAPGFYKIIITSANMQIPVKYGAHTILGAEVPLDADNAETGLLLKLN